MFRRQCYCELPLPKDIDRIDHIAEVTASSLFEAVALGLQVIRKNGWAGEIPGGITTANVCAMEPTVQHKVQIQKLKK
jgi:hypothetical protein